MRHLDHLVKALLGEGVTHAFGIHGDGPSGYLVQALQAAGVPFYQVHHEAAGVIMAGACCRFGRIEAAAITTRGPGFANCFPGLVNNHFENRPAPLLAEYYPPSAPSYRMHQRINHDSAGRGVFKADGTCDSEAIGVRDLLATAREETPGPVLLQIARDPDDSVVCVMPPEHFAYGELGELVDRVRKAQRPALILGGPVVRHVPFGSFDGVRVPVATTAAAKGAISEYLPHAVGVVSSEDLAGVCEVLNQADLLIGIGLRNTEIVRVAPFEAPLITLDMLDGTLYGPYRDGFEPEMEVLRPDLAHAVKPLVEALSGKSWGEEEIARHRQALSRRLDPSWSPSWVLNQLQELGETTLVVDVGPYLNLCETLWRAAVPRDYCGATNGHFGGTGIPTAIGEALVRPSRPVLCLCDEVGLQGYLPELRLAVANALPILFVLLKRETSWLSVVRAFGIPGQSVASAAALRTAASAPTNGPAYLEISF